jgi:hypothetical protein
MKLDEEHQNAYAQWVADLAKKKVSLISIAVG